MAALLIGLSGGALCYYAVNMKSKFGYDDSLDAVGIHGVGGIWGALATGLFASAAVNAAGADGALLGNFGLLQTQVISILAALGYSFVVTYVLLKVLDKTMGLRLTDEQEYEGLDLSQHGESGYAL